MNQVKCRSFCSIGNDFHKECEKFQDDTYSGINRMSDAEKDKDFLYERSLFVTLA